MSNRLLQNILRETNRYASQTLQSKNNQDAYATGRLDHSGRQEDETMLPKIGNAQSRATFFRDSAVLSLPAVLLRKLIALMIPPYLLKEYQSVQRLLSVNLLTGIATNHYQHCQL